MSREVGQRNPTDATVGETDAFHVGGVLVRCDEPLDPGEWVVLQGEGAVGTLDPDKAHGLVDPFLDGRSRTGSRVWVWIKPQFITKIKHQFTLGIEGFDFSPTQDNDDDDDWCRRGC